MTRDDPCARPVPAVDTAAATVLLLAIGRAATRVADDWEAQALAAGLPVHLWRTPVLGPDSRRTLQGLLAALRVGARFMVAGPAGETLTAAAWARAEGLLIEEVTTFVTADGALDVYCAHCAETNRLDVSPGALTTCPSCGRELEVHEHASGHRGSYLASALPGQAPVLA